MTGALHHRRTRRRSAKAKRKRLRPRIELAGERYGLGAAGRRDRRETEDAVLAQREIEAASASNLWHGWGTSPIPINRSVFDALTAIRARSRERGLSDPLARRYVAAAKRNVVGPAGPKLNSVPLRDPAAVGSTIDEFAARVVEERFREWQRPDFCDVQGRLSFRETLNTALADVIYDGEALLRRHRTGPHGLQVEIIDPERLDFRLNKDLEDGGRVVMGVEFDPMGRVVAFHFITPHAVERSVHGGLRVESERVEATEIIHLYMMERSGQIRGIPWFISVIARMKMLHGYIRDAEMASRVGSKSWLFYKTASGAESSVGAAVEGTDGALEMDLDEVGAQQIGEHDDVLLRQPVYPHAQFDPYIKTMGRIISVGVDVSYHTLTGDLEKVNFSSIRQGVLDERDMWTALQHWLFEKLCSPVFEWWLEAALANGVLTFTKGGEPQKLKSDFAKLRRHTWRGKRWPWVDPLKDITAHKMAVEMGASTVGQVIETLGHDPDDVWESRATEITKMQKLGIPTSTAATTVVVDTGSGDDSEEETDDDEA